MSFHFGGSWAFSTCSYLLLKCSIVDGLIAQVHEELFPHRRLISRFPCRRDDPTGGRKSVDKEPLETTPDFEAILVGEEVRVRITVMEQTLPQ
jgi:hypothetical protein